MKYFAPYLYQTRTICKWLFSFGPYGKEVFLLGPITTAHIFWGYNLKWFPNLKIYYSEGTRPRVVPRNFEIKTISCNLDSALKETYEWIHSHPQDVPAVTNKFPLKIKRSNKRFPKNLNLAISLIALILVFPALTLALYAGTIYVSYAQFKSSNPEAAKNSILLAKTIVVIGSRESKVLSYMPILGSVYKETLFAGNAASGFADIFTNTIPAAMATSHLLNGVLGDEIYDPVPDSRQLKVNLEAVYQSASMLQAQAQTSAASGRGLAKKLIEKVDLEKVRTLALQGQTLAEKLPEILGKTKSQTYLILFQNNMELRPTGGFIGSYGLATFDGGRMSDLTVSDIYSADGQLNGHVEPPAPIKTYLGEANWWFRDSNWDPSFPVSAARAEWFLDKELGKEVDGVIAIDLHPIKDILKSTGAIFLADFNMDISGDNLYEKTQNEVQERFFPGTYKKASFLTALARVLISDMSKLNKEKKLKILQSVYENLEERHVQIVFHDKLLQKAISSLKWDGEVYEPTCGKGCYADMVGGVEANLGVNKVNYFIERSTKLEIDITPMEVKRNLTIALKNTASPSLGLAGKYKVYLRILVTGDSEITSVGEITGGSILRIPPDIVETKGRKEIGIPVEVFAGQTKNIEFVWKTIPKEGEMVGSYGVYIRKQAGVGDDPFTLEIDSNGLNLKTLPHFTLTKEGNYVYNTVLARDLFSRISW